MLKLPTIRRAFASRMKYCVPGFSLSADDVFRIYVLEEDHGRLLDGLDKAGVLKS